MHASAHVHHMLAAQVEFARMSGHVPQIVVKWFRLTSDVSKTVSTAPSAPPPGRTISPGGKALNPSEEGGVVVNGKPGCAYDRFLLWLD